MKVRLPRRRLYRVMLYLLATVALAGAVDIVWVRWWRRVTVGPDTTRITAPLKADGMPDYLAYFNQQTSAGVTAENNAALPLMEAIGPSFIQGPVREEVCARLGIRVPAAGAEDFISFGEFVATLRAPGAEVDGAAEKQRVDAEEERVEQAPWGAGEHPEAAAWLKRVERPLRLLHEAVERPRFYVPWVAKTDMVIAALLPALNKARWLADASLARGMMLAQEGRWEEAHGEMIACHRLARLIDQGPTLVEHLVALAVENATLRAEAGLAGSRSIPAEKFRAWGAALEALPALRSMTASIENERLMVLDGLVYVSRHPEFGLFATPFDDAPLPRQVLRAIIPAHFNQALRDVNGFYDGFAAAAAERTSLERAHAMDAMQARAEAYARQHAPPFGDPAKALLPELLPYLTRAIVRQDETMMLQGLTRVALALGAYRAEHGTYPAALEELTPTCLAAVPQDLFVEAPLHYARSAEGFVLYSVGVNRTDNGGRWKKYASLPDPKHSEGRLDDLVVRVPVEASPATAP